MKKNRPYLRRNYHRLKPRRQHGCKGRYKISGMTEAGIVKCPECNSSNTRLGLQGLKCKNCGVLIPDY